MLSSDQRGRLSLLRSLAQVEKKEALEALENNYWDTSMAFEWIKCKRENPDANLEEFHTSYQKAKDEAFVLPADRYDLNNSSKKTGSNRQSRRAQMKQEKKDKRKNK